MYIGGIGLLLSGILCAAIRTHSEELCAEAEHLEPNVFEVDPELDPLLPWVLQTDASCAGEAVCEVAVTPQLDPEEPAKSRLLAAVLPSCSRSGRLYLCGDSTCAAALNLPWRSWRPHHLFSFLISNERMRRLDLKRYFLDELLEIILVVELVGCICAILWLLSEVLMAPRHASPLMSCDEQLRLPDATEVMGEGLLNALCFLLGCILWILASSQFLHKYGSSSSSVDTLILSIPAIFGPFALLRMFFSVSRRQLYHALFRAGFLVTFERRLDVLLLLSLLGLLLGVCAVLTAMTLAEDLNSLKDSLLTQLLVFISPLYTMASAFIYELDAESSCLHRRCTLQLQREALAVATRHGLAALAERSLCRAGREHRELELVEGHHLPEELEGPASFSLVDMMWANRLVYYTSTSSRRFALLLFMPLLMLCIMSLGLGCTMLSMKHRCDAPQLYSLETTTGEILPPLSPSLRRHTLYVDIMRRSVSLEAAADPSQTTRLHGDEGLGITTRGSGDLKQMTKVSLHLDGAAYPMTVRITTGTRSQEEAYEIQILQVTSFIRSLLLRGELENGQHYERCLRGNELNRRLGLPRLRTLHVELATMNVAYGIPRRSHKSFSTVFLKVQDCEAYCLQHSNCYETKVTSSAGCFFIFGPDMDCLDLHHAEASQLSNREALKDLDFKAELCRDQELHDCSALEDLSQHRMVSLPVDAASIPHLALKTRIASSGSNFFLEGSRISLYNGTPPLKTILAQPSSDMKEVHVEVLRHGFDFILKLSYDPLETQQLWNSSSFNLSVAALVDDPSFQFRWEAPEAPAAMQNFTCDEFIYKSYKLCGGHVESPVTVATVNVWAPSQEIHGEILERDFFEAKKVTVKVVTADGLQPLQQLIRKNCSVPVCLGGFYECLERQCRNVRSQKGSVCTHTCNREADENCKKLEREQQFLATVRNSEQIFGSRRTPVIMAMPTPGMADFFTYEVLKDITAHCGLRSGLMHFVRSGLKRYWRSPQKAYAMQIIQQLSLNPDFRANQSAKVNPLLSMLYHVLPMRKRMAFKDLVLYSPDLAELQFAFCSEVNPRELTPDILAAVIDRIAASTVDVERKDWQLVLKSLVACGLRVKHPVDALGCRSQRDMNISSLLSLAPDETTFNLIRPYCAVGPVESGGATSLHLAAQRGWCRGAGVGDVAARQRRESEDHNHFTKVFQAMTPLHEAALSSSWRCLQNFLRQNASTEALASVKVMGNGQVLVFDLEESYMEFTGEAHRVTALHFACDQRCVQCVELLVAQNALVNADMEMAQMRLQWNSKGEPHATALSNCTLRPLDLAFQSGCKECVQTLIQAGAKTDVLTIPGGPPETSPLMELLPRASVRRCELWRAHPGQSFIETLTALATQHGPDG